MTLTRITVNPEVMGGKPYIRGMRVTVGMVVGLLASGKSAGDILAAYPYLEEDDTGVDAFEARLRLLGLLQTRLGTEAVDLVVLNTAPLSLEGRILMTRHVLVGTYLGTHALRFPALSGAPHSSESALRRL